MIHQGVAAVGERAVHRLDHLEEGGGQATREEDELPFEHSHGVPENGHHGVLRAGLDELRDALGVAP